MRGRSDADVVPADQMGVELGKVLAKQITPAISGDEAALASQDPSTQNLIGYYRANRA